MDAPQPHDQAPDPNTTALAGITHLLFFAQTIGLIVAIVLWATRGRENRYLAFQCAQAVVLQATFFAISILFSIAMTAAVFVLVVASGGFAADGEDIASWVFGAWLGVFLGGVGLLLMVFAAGCILAIWLAVRCLQGQDPRLPWLGALAERATGYRPQRA